MIVNKEVDTIKLGESYHLNIKIPGPLYYNNHLKVEAFNQIKEISITNNNAEYIYFPISKGKYNVKIKFNWNFNKSEYETACETHVVVL